MNPYDACVFLVCWMIFGAFFSAVGPARNITLSSAIFGYSFLLNLIVYPIMWLAWPLFALIGYCGPRLEYQMPDYAIPEDDGNDSHYRGYIDDDF